MLGSWLDERWAQADESLRRDFDRLLTFEDDRLFDWLMGRSNPDPGLEDIVEAIRARHFGPSQQ